MLGLLGNSRFRPEREAAEGHRALAEGKVGLVVLVDRVIGCLGE